MHCTLQCLMYQPPWSIMLFLLWRQANSSHLLIVFILLHFEQCCGYWSCWSSPLFYFVQNAWHPSTLLSKESYSDYTKDFVLMMLDFAKQAEEIHRPDTSDVKVIKSPTHNKKTPVDVSLGLELENSPDVTVCGLCRVRLLFQTDCNSGAKGISYQTNQLLY